MQSPFGVRLGQRTIQSIGGAQGGLGGYPTGGGLSLSEDTARDFPFCPVMRLRV